MLEYHVWSKHPNILFSSGVVIFGDKGSLDLYVHNMRSKGYNVSVSVKESEAEKEEKTISFPVKISCHKIIVGKSLFPQ